MSRASMLVVGVAAFLAGCAGRSHVVAPERVQQLNDTEWRIACPPSVAPPVTAPASSPAPGR